MMEKKSDEEKKNMKVAFLGFGEVNTPVDVIVRKCSAAEAALKARQAACRCP